MQIFPATFAVDLHLHPAPDDTASSPGGAGACGPHRRVMHPAKALIVRAGLQRAAADAALADADAGRGGGRGILGLLGLLCGTHPTQPATQTDARRKSFAGYSELVRMESNEAERSPRQEILPGLGGSGRAAGGKDAAKRSTGGSGKGGTSNSTWAEEATARRPSATSAALVFVEPKSSQLMNQQDRRGGGGGGGNSKNGAGSRGGRNRGGDTQSSADRQLSTASDIAPNKPEKFRRQVPSPARLHAEASDDLSPRGAARRPSPNDADERQRLPAAADGSRKAKPLRDQRSRPPLPQGSASRRQRDAEPRAAVPVTALAPPAPDADMHQRQLSTGQTEPAGGSVLPAPPGPDGPTPLFPSQPGSTSPAIAATGGGRRGPEGGTPGRLRASRSRDGGLRATAGCS